MIKNTKMWEQFRRAEIRKEKVDIRRNFQIVNALYQEAKSLGILPVKDPLEGLEIKIKIAKVVNSVRQTHSKNSH
ncbi:MAG: hypothetical protein N3A72_05575 [bacterium]|nr:hypothetical protein [bacterium]